MFEGEPVVQADMVGLLTVQDEFWHGKKFRKLTNERLMNSGLVESKCYLIGSEISVPKKVSHEFIFIRLFCRLFYGYSD